MRMRLICRVSLFLAMTLVLSAAVLFAQDEKEKQLVDLTNEARTQAGLKPLTWDEGLAKAARAHAEKMAADKSISHRYDGEPDVPERVASAGAHFSLIEENVAAADSVQRVQDSWMKSQGHHDNLMNPKIDRIGVGLVSAHGTLYAVADYAQGVSQQGTGDVEASVGKVLEGKGMKLVSDASGARQYCAQEGNAAGNLGSGMQPRFLMKWQSADITNLPPELQKRIASGVFHEAAVGACDAKAGGGGGTPTFSGYRVAVFLY